MLALLKNFLRNENGAITVDWVVLTAGISIVGLIAATAIWSGMTSLAGQTDGVVKKSGTTFIASTYW